MKGTASILLSFATLGSCGTSDAFITGCPVAGRGGSDSVAAPAVASANIGPLRPPARVLNDAGAGGMPALAAGSAAAGAGAPAASGSGAPAAGDSGCSRAKYSLAVRLAVDMTWDETAALMAGTGKFYAWSKLTIEPSMGTISEFRMCGSLQPIYHGTALAGNFSAFQRVPLPSYDAPTMPFVGGGSATRVDSALTLMTPPLLVGLSLPDVAGTWPASSMDPNVMPIDADGDGKPGMTSLMRNDAVFTASPTSFAQTEHIDATYIASRLAFRATLNDAACADTLDGTGELLAMDSLLLGCHVMGRDDCRPEELSFFEDNRPPFKLSTMAVVNAVVIPSDASCTQAVKVLEVAAP